uniref:BED-type domain-containing protein n=1 Tax=Denticeps clupeoides TaxID=299321 RepID=A0AAY4BX16_9TELE
MERKKRSVVWSFFQAENHKKVRCSLCRGSVLHFGRTTNMLRHLRTVHPGQLSAELHTPNHTSAKMAAARKRSVVWSYFHAENDKRVLCMICMKTVLYFGHTTNMLRHLRTKHPTEFADGGPRNRATRTAEPSVPNNNSSSGGEGGGGAAASPPVAVVVEDDAAPLESDTEMDGAIEGILRAAAGDEAVTEGQHAERLPQEEEEEEEEGGRVAAPTTSRKWSAVWAHYEKVEQQQRARCLLCGDKLQYHSSTSNLLRHLLKRHPTQHAQLEGSAVKRPATRKGAPADTPISRPAQKPAPETPTDHSPRTHTHYPAADWSEGRILQRERELTEALRRVQREEGRSLEQQRELLQQSRELQAEKDAHLEDVRALAREKEGLSREKEELHKEREELCKEREELDRLRKDLEAERAVFIAQRQEVEFGCGAL